MQLVTQAAPVVQRDKLIPLTKVQDLTSLGKSALYAAMRDGRFPRSVALSPKRVAWSEAAVLSWIEARKAEAAQANAGQAELVQ